jgi:hypothetical protein
MSPSNCFSKGGPPRGGLKDLSRGGGYEYDEYSLATVHYMTLYMYSLLIPIRAFPSEGRTTWVSRYSNISKGSDAYYTTITSRYVHVRTFHLTSQMMPQARYPMHNVIPPTGRDASHVC